MLPSHSCHQPKQAENQHHFAWAPTCHLETHKSKKQKSLMTISHLADISPLTGHNNALREPASCLPGTQEVMPGELVLAGRLLLPVWVGNGNARALHCTIHTMVSFLCGHLPHPALPSTLRILPFFVIAQEIKKFMVYFFLYTKSLASSFFYV